MSYSVPSRDFPMSTRPPTWKHPAASFASWGADKRDESEPLAVLISTGTKGSLACLANQPLERLLSIKRLGGVKSLRIAAVLEIARRTANEIIRGK